VADVLGIKFADDPGFSCCGFPIDNINYNTALTIAARNLAIAESKNLDIITLCSACTGYLTKISKIFFDKKNIEEIEKVNNILKEYNLSYKGTVKVRHFSRFLYEDIGINKLKKYIKNPLDGIKIAPHYGCHYTKPSDIFDGFDDPIHPKSLDELIEVTGATSVNYKDKMQCCGGGILAVSEDTSTEIVKQKLENIKEAKADAMTLFCPFCNIMYDEYQPSIESKYETEYNIPVLYYPQLLGLALGLDPKKDLAVKKNQVKVKPLLQKLEQIRNGGELL
jgi:heterodisulfide reductase subunit B